MNRRIRFTIIFSAPEFPYQAVMNYLTPKLSQLFAGACCQPVDGIWSPDGNQDKLLYLEGKQEAGMKITLSIMPLKKQETEKKIQDILQALKTQLNLSIHWVHVESEEVTAHHFHLH